MPPELQIDDVRFQERGFGQRIGFGHSPALILVDLIQGFTNPDCPLGSDLDDVIETNNILIQAFRERGAPIYFFVLGYRADLEDAGVWRHKMGGLSSLLEGSDNVKLDPRLDFRADADHRLLKKYASCFAGTDLASRLTASGIDTLVISGCTTSGCVRATVVDAVQSGFRPIVVPESVGDRSSMAHRQSLLDIDAKYGDVMPLAAVLDHLARPQPSPASRSAK